MFKRSKALALIGLGLSGLIPQEEERTPDREVNTINKEKRSIFRFYEDGSWTHKQKKGVVFTCLADNKREAKKKFKEWQKK